MGARILVIEDHPANLDLVRYLLEHGGHTVLTATDGGAGVATALRELPDLVICDLQMPVLDGYQVLAQLRTRLASSHPLVVVAVTAYSMPNDRNNVMTSGFNGYLSKPIDPEAFVAQIEAYLPSGLRSAPPPPVA